VEVNQTVELASVLGDSTTELSFEWEKFHHRNMDGSSRAGWYL